MSQNSVIFFYLLVGFVIYITVRGQLPAYMAVLTGKTTGSGTSGAGALFQGLTGGSGLAQPLTSGNIPTMTITPNG